MRSHHVAVICAAAAMFVTPALAKSANSSAIHSADNPPSTASKSDASHPDITNMQQSLKRDLTKAGFKDITVSAASFNVRATNSSGQKVYMLVGPESLTQLVSGQGPNAQHPNGGQASSSK